MLLVRGYFRSVDDLDVLKIAHLSVLDLSGLSIDDARLTAIVQHCPCIIHLSLLDSYTITDAAMYTVATTLKLKTIAIPSDFNLTDRTLEHLHHCRGTLEALHITHWSSSSFRPIKLTLPAVQTLIRSAHNSCRYTWSAYVSREEDLSKCAHATSLRVSTKFTDALLTKIAQTCIHLEKLNIHFPAKNVTSVGLYAVINNCPKLKTIHISRNSRQNMYRRCTEFAFKVVHILSSALV